MNVLSRQFYLLNDTKEYGAPGILQSLRSGPLRISVAMDVDGMTVLRENSECRGQCLSRGLDYLCNRSLIPIHNLVDPIGQ